MVDAVIGLMVLRCGPGSRNGVFCRIGVNVIRWLPAPVSFRLPVVSEPYQTDTKNFEISGGNRDRSNLHMARSALQLSN